MWGGSNIHPKRWSSAITHFLETDLADIRTQSPENSRSSNYDSNFIFKPQFRINSRQLKVAPKRPAYEKAASRSPLKGPCHTASQSLLRTGGITIGAEYSVMYLILFIYCVLHVPGMVYQRHPCYCTAAALSCRALLRLWIDNNSIDGFLRCQTCMDSIAHPPQIYK